MIYAPGLSQDAPLGTFQDVVPGVIAEPAQWHPAADRFFLRGDYRVNPTPLQRGVDLAIRVTLVGGDGLDGSARGHGHSIRLALDLAAFVCLPGGDLHIENDAAYVINRGVLLIPSLVAADSRRGFPDAAHM